MYSKKLIKYKSAFHQYFFKVSTLESKLNWTFGFRPHKKKRIACCTNTGIKIHMCSVRFISVLQWFVDLFSWRQRTQQFNSSAQSIRFMQHLNRRPWTEKMNSSIQMISSQKMNWKLILLTYVCVVNKQKINRILHRIRFVYVGINDMILVTIQTFIRNASHKSKCVTNISILVIMYGKVIFYQLKLLHLQASAHISLSNVWEIRYFILNDTL